MVPRIQSAAALFQNPSIFTWLLLACLVVSFTAIAAAILAIRNFRPRIKKQLVVLEVIVGVAPLVGLIGTVLSLVNLFFSVGVGTSAADPKEISHGISEALNFTVFGLGIAVPTLIAFVYFSKKVEALPR